MTAAIYREFILYEPAIARVMNAFLRDQAGPAADRGTPLRVVVTEKARLKSRDQEAKYHAMFGDIARDCTFMGQKWGADDWKRLLVDAFARVMAEAGTPLQHSGRIIPSLDGKGVVQLGIQTRQFRRSEASEFIEFLYAWGAENGVRWSATEEIAA